MDEDQRKATEVAQRYFGTTQPPKMLGWGISGHVFLSPDLQTAVKVHRREESFARELYVYRELSRLRITHLHGLTVPKLREYDASVKIIRMDFVSAPYLLDFAGVLLSPPDYSEDTMAIWHAGIVETYGPNAPIVYDVYHSLSKHDLYYMDFRVSNLNLDGLPGLLPMPSEDEGEY